MGPPNAHPLLFFRQTKLTFKSFSRERVIYSIGFHPPSGIENITNNSDYQADDPNDIGVVRYLGGSDRIRPVYLHIEPMLPVALPSLAILRRRLFRMLSKLLFER